MSRYTLVMKSGYEQKVEADETLLLKWEHVSNISINLNSDKVYTFNNGLKVNLSDVSIIKPYRDIGDYPPPPPPNSLRPRIVVEGLLSGFEPRKESSSPRDFSGFEPRKESRY